MIVARVPDMATDPQKTAPFLTEWIIDYVKHKDIYTKSIQAIEHQGHCVQIKHTTKVHWYVVLPLVDVKKIHDALTAHPNDHVSLVTLNLRQNLALVMDHWKEFVGYERFNIYFVNPFSATDKRWIISPHVHNKICDESALKQGLESIFLTVDEVTNSALGSMEKKAT